MSSLFGPDLENDEIQYLEGGLQAWHWDLSVECKVLLSRAELIPIRLSRYRYMNTISTYNTYLSTHQLSDYSESSIGWIFSVYIFLTFFCGIQIGPVFDARGPRLLVLSGGILMMASIMPMKTRSRMYSPRCRNLDPFLVRRRVVAILVVFGILGGAGTSLIVTPVVAAIGHFFLAELANATGNATTGGSIGGIIFPLMLELLFSKVGWGWATRIQGFVFLVLQVLANLLIRARLRPLPDGSVLPNANIFRLPAFVQVTIAAYFLKWGLFVPVTYLTGFCLDSGAMSPIFAFQVIAIYNAASSVGRWASGFLADRFGRYDIMIVTVFFCMSSSIGLWLPAAVFSERDSNHAAKFGLTVSYSMLMGMAFGSNISLAPVCVGVLQQEGIRSILCDVLHHRGIRHTYRCAYCRSHHWGKRWSPLGCRHFYCRMLFLCFGLFCRDTHSQVGWRWDAIY